MRRNVEWILVCAAAAILGLIFAAAFVAQAMLLNELVQR